MWYYQARKLFESNLIDFAQLKKDMTHWHWWMEGVELLLYEAEEIGPIGHKKSEFKVSSNSTIVG